MLLLALDPGRTNFSYAILEDCSIQNVGFLKTCDNVDLNSIRGFRQQLDLLIEHVVPEHVIIERYMFRGMSSKWAEYINLMIGVLVSVLIKHDIPFSLITPAQWKVHLRKNWELYGGDESTEYDNRTSKYLPNCQELKTAHESDAVAMGLYYLLRILKKEFKKPEALAS